MRQHELVEKSATGNKETDRALSATIDKELRDEKAVKVAISRIYRGEYSIAQDVGEDSDGEENTSADEATQDRDDA